MHILFFFLHILFFNMCFHVWMYVIIFFPRHSIQITPSSMDSVFVMKRCDKSSINFRNVKFSDRKFNYDAIILIVLKCLTYVYFWKSERLCLELSWGKKWSVGMFRSTMKVFSPWLFVSEWKKNLSFTFYIIYNPNLDEYESNQQLQAFHSIINDQICVKHYLLLLP